MSDRSSIYIYINVAKRFVEQTRHKCFNVSLAMWLRVQPQMLFLPLLTRHNKTTIIGKYATIWENVNRLVQLRRKIKSRQVLISS